MCSFFFCLSEQEVHGQFEEGSEGGAQWPGCGWHWPGETAPWALHFLWAAQLPCSLVSLSVPDPPVSMFLWCGYVCLIHQWVCFLGVAVCAGSTSEYVCLIHQWVCFLGVAGCAGSTSEYVSLEQAFCLLWCPCASASEYFFGSDFLLRFFLSDSSVSLPRVHALACAILVSVWYLPPPHPPPPPYLSVLWFFCYWFILMIFL